MLNHRLPTLCALLVLYGSGVASAADGVGPFQMTRRVFDPADPHPHAIARDGTVEKALKTSGNNSAGRIALTAWSGDNQAGTRGVSGLNLALPPGKNAWLGLRTDWAIQEGSDASGSPWVYYPKYAQDALWVAGFADTAPASLPTAHGTGWSIDAVQPYDRLLLVLPWRWVPGGGSIYQVGSHSGGNPPEAGLFAVPANISLSQAQAAPATWRLAGLDGLLQEIQPHLHAASFKLQVLAGGGWSLGIDINDDGVVDVLTNHGATGHKPSPFTAMTERSGLILSTRAAMGSNAGRVGRTLATLSYRLSPSAPATTMDRRPFTATFPAMSATSPVRIAGTRWSPEHAVTASSSANPGGVGAVAGHGHQVYTDLHLLPTGAPTDLTLRQAGTPTTDRSGAVTWIATDISQGGSLAIRTGDSLRYTYVPGCGPQNAEIDANGDGTPDYIGDGCEPFIYRYEQPGVYLVRAAVRDPSAPASDTLTVTVGSVNFDGPIACQVGYRREKGVELSGFAPGQVFFTAADRSLLEVSVKEATPYGVRLYLKALGRGTPVVQARTGSATGPVIAEREIDEFTVHNDAADALLANADTASGTATVTIKPHIPALDYRMEMFAHRSSFAGGAKVLNISTNSFKKSTDPVTGETVGAFSYRIFGPLDEQSFCCRAVVDQKSKYGTPASATLTINGSKYTVVVWQLTMQPDEDPMIQFVRVWSDEKAKPAILTHRIEGVKSKAIERKEFQGMPGMVFAKWDPLISREGVTQEGSWDVTITLNNGPKFRAPSKYVIQRIKITQFSPKSGKFPKCQGESISRDDFVIVTSPSGNEDKVAVDFPNGTTVAGKNIKATAKLGKQVEEAGYEVVARGEWVPVANVPPPAPDGAIGQTIGPIIEFRDGGTFGTDKWYRITTTVGGNHSWKRIGINEVGPTATYETSQSDNWTVGGEVTAGGKIGVPFVAEGEVSVTISGSWETSTTHTLTSGPGGEPYTWRFGHYQQVAGLGVSSTVDESTAGNAGPWTHVNTIPANITSSGTTRYYQSEEKKCP